MYKANLKCSLGCSEEDTLEHIYICPVLDQHVKSTDIRISDIYTEAKKQKIAVSEFIYRENMRSVLLQATSTSQGNTQILDMSTRAADVA